MYNLSVIHSNTSLKYSEVPLAISVFFSNLKQINLKQNKKLCVGFLAVIDHSQSIQ